jgi:hypothetical protein
VRLHGASKSAQTGSLDGLTNCRRRNKPLPRCIK